MSAEPVLAEQLAAIRRAPHAFAPEVFAREVEEAVVERPVRGEDNLRADVVQDSLEPLDAQ